MYRYRGIIAAIAIVVRCACRAFNSATIVLADGGRSSTAIWGPHCVHIIELASVCM